MVGCDVANVTRANLPPGMDYFDTTRRSTLSPASLDMSINIFKNYDLDATAGSSFL